MDISLVLILSNFETILGVFWAKRHLEAYLTSPYPLRKPLEALKLLSKHLRDVAGDVRPSSNSALCKTSGG